MDQNTSKKLLAIYTQLYKSATFQAPAYLIYRVKHILARPMFERRDKS